MRKGAYSLSAPIGSGSLKVRFPPIPAEPRIFAEGPCLAKPERVQHGTVPCASRPLCRAFLSAEPCGHILRRSGGGGGGGGARTRCQIVPPSNWIVMPSGE